MEKEKNDLKALHEHMQKCSLCQSKNPPSEGVKKEHADIKIALKNHMISCSECRAAKKEKDLCKYIKIFINQDFRTIRGTKNFSRRQYNISKSGEIKAKHKTYVKNFDPRILSDSDSPSNPEEAEIFSSFAESGHGFRIYDVEAPIPDGVTDEQKQICRLILLGFTQKEIAEEFGISRQAITKKLKKIGLMVAKKPIQLPLYNREKKQIKI